MLKKLVNPVFLSLLVSFFCIFSCVGITIEDAVKSEKRTKDYTNRDKYRNPIQTLSFFKIKNNFHVLELQPSGSSAPRGWYTEILAPFLKENGKLTAAHFDPTASEWRSKFRNKFELQVKNEDDFKNINITTLFMPPKSLTKPESVDMVLTFRNLHNWLKVGYLKEVFKVSFDALKPGGVFGVVEHRAPNSFTVEEMIKSGYVSESKAIEIAKEVGFVLDEKSEINANGLDLKDHTNGVWSLPPTLKLTDAKNRSKNLSIGESDRMTLRFIKP